MGEEEKSPRDDATLERAACEVDGPTSSKKGGGVRGGANCARSAAGLYNAMYVGQMGLEEWQQDASSSTKTRLHNRKLTRNEESR